MEGDRERRTWFVEMKVSSKSKDYVPAYYTCNRTFVPESESKITMKSQGSSRIVLSCCAFLTIKMCFISGVFTVTYSMGHTGQGTKFAHLHLSAVSPKHCCQADKWYYKKQNFARYQGQYSYT